MPAKTSASRKSTKARKPARKATSAKPGKPAGRAKPGKVASVKDYLAALPEDRRKALEAVRKVVRKNLDKQYEEGIQYGMIGWYVPHRVYPDGYHCDPEQPLPFASLASQKHHMALYMFCIYGSKDAEQRFRKAWTKSGRKLDMGKSCIRFKKLEDVALDAIGDAVKAMPAKKFIAMYESNLEGAGRRKRRR